MTALTTEARSDLITAFSGLGFKVYSVAPPVPKAPSIVIVPDSPWVRPDRVGSNLNYEVRWRVLAVISPRNNEVSQLDSENAVDAILAAMPAGYLVTQVGPPSITDTGAQGSVITIEIAVSAHMKE